MYLSVRSGLRSIRLIQIFGAQLSIASFCVTKQRAEQCVICIGYETRLIKNDLHQRITVERTPHTVFPLLRQSHQHRPCINDATGEVEKKPPAEECIEYWAKMSASHTCHPHCRCCCCSLCLYAFFRHFVASLLLWWCGMKRVFGAMWFAIPTGSFHLIPIEFIAKQHFTSGGSTQTPTKNS